MKTTNYSADYFRFLFEVNKSGMINGTYNFINHIYHFIWAHDIEILSFYLPKKNTQTFFSTMWTWGYFISLELAYRGSDKTVVRGLQRYIKVKYVHLYHWLSNGHLLFEKKILTHKIHTVLVCWSVCWIQLFRSEKRVLFSLL